MVRNGRRGANDMSTTNAPGNAASAEIAVSRRLTGAGQDV
jgi:hypothetical protein